MPRSLSNPTVAAQPKPAVKQKDRDPIAAGMRDAAYNRSASYNYALFDRFEAGVALRGTEVKSIREGKTNLKDAYGLLKDGECFLLNAHIGPFSHGNAMNHEALRTRKLLLHKTEVRKLEGMTKQKGFTLIPTRLYFRNGRGRQRGEVGYCAEPKTVGGITAWVALAVVAAIAGRSAAGS
jgi:SsrA-binding protein